MNHPLLVAQPFRLNLDLFNRQVPARAFLQRRGKSALHEQLRLSYRSVWSALITGFGGMQLSDQLIDRPEKISTIMNRHINPISQNILQNLPNLLVDERRIFQVLIRLFTNAIKFNRSEEHVTLEGEP